MAHGLIGLVTAILAPGAVLIIAPGVLSTLSAVIKGVYVVSEYVVAIASAAKIVKALLQSGLHRPTPPRRRRRARNKRRPPAPPTGQKPDRADAQD